MQMVLKRSLLHYSCMEGQAPKHANSYMVAVLGEAHRGNALRQKPVIVA